MPEKMRTGRAGYGTGRARPSRALRLSGSDYDRYALHRVVRVALEVPRRRQGLLVAGGVGRSRAEHVLARRRLPAEPPAAPGGLAERLIELGRRERHAAIGRDLDPLDRAEAGPGAARQRGGAGLEVALAAHELGHAGRDHQGPRQHAGERVAGLAAWVVHPVGDRVLVALEGPFEQRDAGEPLDVRHAVPAR